MKIPDNFIIANGPQWLAHGVKTIARRLNLLFFRKNGKIPKSNFNRCVLAEFIIIAFQTKKTIASEMLAAHHANNRTALALICLVSSYICAVWRTPPTQIHSVQQSSSSSILFFLGEIYIPSLRRWQGLSWQSFPAPPLSFSALTGRATRFRKKTERKPHHSHSRLVFVCLPIPYSISHLYVTTFAWL